MARSEPSLGGFRSSNQIPDFDVSSSSRGNAAERIKYFRQVMSNLQDIRRPLEDHWRALAKNIIPYELRFINYSSSNSGNPAYYGKRNNSVIDTNGMRIARLCAIGLTTGLVPKHLPWIRLSIGNNPLSENPFVGQWLYEASQTILNIYAESNFYQVMESVFLDCAVFGPACFYFERHPTKVLNVHKLNIGEWWYAVNSLGDVDTVSRQLWMTPRQMAERFGVDKLSPNTRGLLKAGTMDSYQKVFHVVQANPNFTKTYDGLPVPWYNKAYSSVYFEESPYDNKGEYAFLAEGGYDYMPFLVLPWDDTGGLYGHSPGMNALPDVLSLMALKEDRLDIAAKRNNPPMVMSSANFANRVMQYPGATNIVDTISGGQGQGINPLQSYFGDTTDLLQLTAELVESINDSFFVRYILAFLGGDTAQMTAYEAGLRQAEKMSVVSSFSSRTEQKMNHLHEVTFRFALEAGRIPPMPVELEEYIMSGNAINLEYTSAIAMAQQGTAVQSILQLAGITGQLASIDPSAADKLNGQQAVDEVAKLLGAPTAILRSDEECEQIAQARQQALEQQQQMDMMKTGAKAMKDAGAQTDPNSFMGQVTQGIQEQAGGPV